MDKKEADKIWDLAKELKVAMVVTEDNSTNTLRSRPMHIVQDEFDGTFWFYTKASGDKVDEIKDDSRVNLAFACREDGDYLSVSGTARINRRQDLIDKYWNPFVAAWFPEGKDSPKCTLMEIKVTQAESWESKSNKMVQLYKIAKANIKDELPDMGENTKYG